MPTHEFAMHVALNVRELERATAFYTALFGAPPAKRRADYAKFELDEPPLVLSLNHTPGAEPRDRSQPGGLSHLGLRVTTDHALAAAHARILAAGLEISLEEPGVTCCYAVQDKFWINDPDGNAWEWYRVLADAEQPSEEAGGSSCCSPDMACSEEVC